MFVVILITEFSCSELLVVHSLLHYLYGNSINRCLQVLMSAIPYKNIGSALIWLNSASKGA